MNTKKYLDQEGVKHLWSRISMEDYPNNETLMAVINAIDETKANKSDIKQPDWNQADSTATNYIKNKPKEITDDEIINIMIQADAFPVVTDTNGNIMTDETGAILLI